MSLRAAAVLLALAAVPAGAQEKASNGTGAVLRGLDKLNAKVTDIVLQNGETEVLGLIEIALKECRYPEGDPSGDAYAFLTIREAGVAKPVFSGWMIASSPALNAMDHARFDVWVLRCTLPD
ncbi:DUF2155 domain-containing protein [Antarctobacter sp.]|uniref:DUF2155 domain-containing protein n=1 Tax=Antarctobacter sp. TaxID=1872577 RepID=UPI002B269FD9|nr:DUF2155 domain-containing protein [Antarctobacter sp.]